MCHNRFASETWIARLLTILEETAPDFATYVHHVFRKGHYLYPYNTFLVKTEHFEQMCATLYPIILRLTEEWLHDPSPKVSLREPGFITEFLVGTYWRWLEDTGQAHFLHGQCITFLKNGHGHWFLPVSRVIYRFLPDALVACGSKLHFYLVKLRFLPAP